MNTDDPDNSISSGAGRGRKKKVVVDKSAAAAKSKGGLLELAKVKKVEQEKVAEEDKLQYDPEDDVWTLEVATASTGRKFARSLMGAFGLLMQISIFLGLFPLVAYRMKDGTYRCKFKWGSHATILFLFAGCLVVGSTIWLFIALLCISTNTPEQRGEKADIHRSEEIFILKRNAVFVVIIFASYMNLTACMSAVFFRRVYIAKQLIYWTEVVELLKLDVGRNVGKMILRHLLVLVMFAIAIVGCYIFNLSPGLAGSGSTLYFLTNRPFNPVGHWASQMSIRKQVFAFFILYVVIAGYVYILWFFFNCRILTNIIKIWNNRFQYCLHKQIIDSMTQQASKEIREGVKSANRTSRAQLFQDHLVIFNLIEGVNTQFEVIMESFYLSNMIMMVFEMYGFVHAQFYAEFRECGARRWDMVPTFLFLALQIYFFMVVTLEAAGVADEARNVLHIVRRKGMMTSKLDMELWFMLSMRLSFGGHEDVGIIGAGFVYVTRAFLLGAISAMTSHFIIYYQFEVPYGQTVDSDANFPNVNVQALLQQLEGVKDTKC